MCGIKIICSGLLCLLSAFSFSQQVTKNDSTKREATIQHSVDENRIRFSALTPPLQQMQGAPAAFYTYYWEFGDGDYSTQPTPTHTYKKEGDHTVRLWATNNYDNGKPPPSRPQKVSVKKIAYNDDTDTGVLGITDGLNLKSNREPVPNEEMVVVLSYQNENDYPTNGKLYIFFNEKQFKADNFELSEVRTYYGEKEMQELEGVAAHITSYDPSSMFASNTSLLYTNILPKIKGPQLSLSSALSSAKERYRNFHILEFDNMGGHEMRNVFFTFKTTPEMLKDTSARVTIKGIYVPERGVDKHKSKDLEMEIVTSHDPNKMSISDTRLNYRFYKNRDLQFKVRFQNNGEGPAHSIKLNVDIPEMFDKSSLQVKETYPVCPICPDGEVTYSCLDTLLLKDKIVFHFRNIYLPGSNQKNVNERDSTKGFVKYTLRFNKKISKKKSVSRTAIIFDKNEPILTNYATTRFKPGLSLGIKAGINTFPALTDSKSYFGGITLSPYKPQHGFLQAELMLGMHSYYDSTKQVQITRPSPDFTRFDSSFLKNNYNNIVMSLVPVSYRYNLNKYVSLGSGIQLSTNISEKISQGGTRELTNVPTKQDGQVPIAERFPIPASEVKSTFTHWNTAVFGDVTLGSARIGPTAGVRYVYNFNSPNMQWQFYILWKI